MVETLLAEARKKLAPDRRTVVFDVKGELAGSTLTLRGEIHDAQLKEQLVRFIREQKDYTIIDSLTVLPAKELGDETVGVVSLSVANIRTHPDHGAEMGTQAILGTPVKILKKHGGWLYVQTPDEYLGWTDDNIVRMTREAYAQWSDRPKIIVTAEYGWVRESRANAALPVSDVVAGALLALKADARTHYEVEYPDGRSGFLPKGDARPFREWLAGARDTPESVAKTAKRFTGVPYLWGGTSAKGMDCSGFTKTVYYLNGTLLPRDASQQVLVGDPVSLPDKEIDLKAGDLLFFGFKATADKPERVTHVAISLGGKRFIHASGQVRINSLNPADGDYSDFRFETFLRAKRIIGAGEHSGVRRLATIPYYRSNEP
jgi:cell wall-associated NlpC family hydrolase